MKDESRLSGPDDPRLHYEAPLRPSPFHARTAPLNRHAAWAPWAGFLAAQHFGDAAMEHAAIRNAAALIDIAPMTKYRVTGPEAAAFLDRLLLRPASRLPVGAVHYTAWCDDAGCVLDDGTLFRLSEQEFRLCCQERHLPWLLDTARGFEAEVEDVSDAIAALALQGPCSFAVLRAAGGEALADLRPFRHRTVALGAAGEVLVSRTGFTGDLGYELWTDAPRALPLWDHLMQAGAPWHLRPVGTEALDLARIEAGHIVAGLDFVPAGQALRADRARTPAALGLGWMVDLARPGFNGRRALMAEARAGGPAWALVGLDIEGNLPAEHAILYLDGKREVGQVTAAAWSPMTKRNIALAQLQRPWDTRAGDRLRAEVYALRELRYEKMMLRARVAPRPFLDLPRRRATPPALF
jgi:aminomethyltransferase